MSNREFFDKRVEQTPARIAFQQWRDTILYPLEKCSGWWKQPDYEVVERLRWEPFLAGYQAGREIKRRASEPRLRHSHGRKLPDS